MGRETDEIASEHFASLMAWRWRSWLCLVGAVLWMALWFLIDERIEEGATWSAPLDGFGPLGAAMLASALVLIATLPTLIGLSGALEAVSVPPPTPLVALLAVRRLPAARVLVVLGLLGTFAVPPLTLVGLETSQVLPLMALPLVLVVLVPPLSSWVRSRSGALAVARRRDGTFQLLRWAGGRAVPADHGPDGLLGQQLVGHGVRWRPGAESAVRRWRAESRLHPSDEEIRELTLPWSWAGERGNGRAHLHERAGQFAYGAAGLAAVVFMLVGGFAVAVITIADGNGAGTVAGGALVVLGIVVLIRFVKQIGRTH